MSITDPTDREALAQSLAETYRTSSTASSWQLVQEYRRVQAYAAEHPEQGSSAVAEALGLPRSRIRGWVDGDGRPDAQRGIEIAERRGWLDLGCGSAMARTMTVLVAWIFSGGSITDNWIPSLSVDSPGTEALAHDALGAAGVDSTTVRADDPERATEVRPTDAGSVLGRLLVVLGAPRGAKSDADLSLPEWIHEAPREQRLTFARTYVWNRGTERTDRLMTPVQINEERAPGYHEELKRIFRSLVGDEAVRGDSTNIRLTAEGASVLWNPPEIPSDDSSDSD